MFRATEILPRPVRLVTQRALHKVSAGISLLTLGRVDFV
jgi:hypothetical protein